LRLATVGAHALVVAIVVAVAPDVTTTLVVVVVVANDVVLADAFVYGVAVSIAAELHNMLYLEAFCS
jgi:hypothetical protein